MIYALIGTCIVCFAILLLMVHLENRQNKRWAKEIVESYFK